jgi:hypothetical protein
LYHIYIGTAAAALGIIEDKEAVLAVGGAELN